MARMILLAAALSLAGCRCCRDCCERPRPKVERCLKVGLTEKAPYVNPPDIAAEMTWKW